MTNPISTGIMEAIIGTKGRLTTSSGVILPIAATVMITPTTGEMVRPIPAAKRIRIRAISKFTAKFAAIMGTMGIKAMTDALPEPVINADSSINKEKTTAIPSEPNDTPSATLVKPAEQHYAGSIWVSMLPNIIPVPFPGHKVVKLFGYAAQSEGIEYHTDADGDQHDDGNAHFDGADEHAQKPNNSTNGITGIFLRQACSKLPLCPMLLKQSLIGFILVRKPDLKPFLLQKILSHTQTGKIFFYIS